MRKGLPLTFKGGAARHFLDGKLAAGADLDWLAQDERFCLSLGGEYLLNRNFAFRAGEPPGFPAVFICKAPVQRFRRTGSAFSASSNLGRP